MQCRAMDNEDQCIRDRGHHGSHVAPVGGIRIWDSNGDDSSLDAPGPVISTYIEKPQERCVVLIDTVGLENQSIRVMVNDGQVFAADDLDDPEARLVYGDPTLGRPKWLPGGIKEGDLIYSRVVGVAQYLDGGAYVLGYGPCSNPENYLWRTMPANFKEDDPDGY